MPILLIFLQRNYGENNFIWTFKNEIWIMLWGNLGESINKEISNRFPYCIMSVHLFVEDAKKELGLYLGMKLKV